MVGKNFFFMVERPCLRSPSPDNRLLQVLFASTHVAEFLQCTHQRATTRTRLSAAPDEEHIPSLYQRNIRCVARFPIPLFRVRECDARTH